MIRRRHLLLLWPLLLACGEDGAILPDGFKPPRDAAPPDRAAPDLAPPDSSPDQALPDMTPACPTFAQPVKQGQVNHKDLTEISGLVFSRANPGVAWTHNDSGDTARLFAMDEQGRHLGIYRLKGAKAVDWEDMAAGPGPDSGAQYLYVGDIGDNPKTRAGVVVYRVKEPKVSASKSPPTVDLGGVATLRLRYPDGSHDAETLLVDPISGDLYIVVKDLGGISGVYRSAAPHDEQAARTLVKVHTLTFGKGPLKDAKFTMTTAGDVSADGKVVLVRTYLDVFLWRRAPGTTLHQALGGAPCAMPLASETQGEAIALHPKTGAYYTVSEGSKPPIYRYAPK